MASDSQDSSGGGRRGNRSSGQQGGSSGGRGGGRSRASGGRGPGTGRGQGQRSGSGGGQASPLEVAVRSTRNALKRHAESVRDDQSKLACRGVLTAIVGVGKRSASPAEVIGLVEQVLHVMEAGRREESQLPVAVRAVASFALEQPRRARDVSEMLRLSLRCTYAVAADHIPRQTRDDGGFRASALSEVLLEIGALYLDDERFAALAR